MSNNLGDIIRTSFLFFWLNWINSMAVGMIASLSVQMLSFSLPEVTSRTG